MTMSTNSHPNALAGSSASFFDDQQEQTLLFSVLPLDLLHSILSLVPLTERSVLLSISKQFTSIVTHPSFLLTRKSNGTADEILFLIGGTCPTRTRRGLGGSMFGTGHRSRSLMGEQGSDLFSRGLWGYMPSERSWRIFGGDPRRVPDHPMQTIVDSKTVFLPHPYYQVVLLGGYNPLCGEEVDRVISYSLLTGKWSTLPSMLRARKGPDLHAQFVPPNQLMVIGCSHGKCGCSRCAGGSISHDALDVDCCLASKNTLMSAASFRNKVPPQVTSSGIHCANRLYGQTAFFDEGKMKGSGGAVGAVFDGHAEVFDLTEMTWTRRQSRAPSCPPRDGGAVVLEDRYIVMPGVERSKSSKISRSTCAWRSNGAKRASGSDMSATSGSDIEDDSSDDSDIGSPIAQSPPSSPMSYSGCSSPALPASALDSSRQGLIYDVEDDAWTVIKCNRSSSTVHPTTLAYKDHVLVMGGYRSGRSGDSIMSLFRDGLISDYEEHALNCWTYSRKEGTWRNGLDRPDTLAEKEEGEVKSDNELKSPLPRCIPLALRGASALVYNGRLTLLGGMTTFNASGDDEERRVIWQYHGEEQDKDLSAPNDPDDDETNIASSATVEDEPSEASRDASSSTCSNGWRPLFLEWHYGKSTQVKLPVSSLLDTCAFSAHI